MKSNEFKNIEIKVSKLLPIFENYVFEDLARACFTINVYKLNKSCQETQMALNLSLFRTKKHGEKRINTYKEFTSFYESIKDIVRSTVFDDYIVEDFGEVKIIFDNEIFSILIGTGYSHSYIAIKLLIEFSKKYNKGLELKKVIKYSSDLLNFFHVQKYIDISNNTDLNIPTEKIFNLTKEYFNQFESMQNIEYLENLLQSELIEHSYFIKKDKLYPLYNTGMLISLWNKWISSTELKDRILLNRDLLYEYLNVMDSFHSIDSDPIALFPVMLRNNEYNISNDKIDFVLMSKNGIILGIQTENYDDTLKQLINKIENSKAEGGLHIYEKRIYTDKKNRVIDINKNCQIQYLIYNSYNNPCLPNCSFAGGSHNRIYTFFDIYGFLLYAVSIEEIIEFLKYDKKSDNIFEICFGGKICKFLTWKDNNHIVQTGAIDYSIINYDYNNEDWYLYNFFKQNSGCYPFLSSKYLFEEPFIWEINKVDNNIYQYVNKYCKGFGGLTISINNKTIFFAQNAEFLLECNYAEEIQIISVVDDIIKKFLKENYKNFKNKDLLKFKLVEVLYMPEIVFVENNDLKYNGIYIKYSYKIENNNCHIIYTIDKMKLLMNIHDATNREVEMKFIFELLSVVIKDEQIDYFNETLVNTSKKKKTVTNLLFNINYYYNNKTIIMKINDEIIMNVENRLAKLVKLNGFNIGEYRGNFSNAILRKLISSLIDDIETSMCRYNEYDLHIVLLSYLSSVTHEIYIDKLKYGSFQDLDDAIKVDIDNSIMLERENNRELYRAIIFCIETNFSIKHTNVKHFSKEDILELIVISKKIILLNDFAELSAFLPDMVSIKINDDFTISQLMKNEKHNEDVIRNRYNVAEYSIQNIQLNTYYIDKINEAFTNYYGFSIADLSDACIFLMAICDKKAEEIIDNVFKISIVKFYEELEKVSKISKEKIAKILLYLCIDKNKIKINKNGTSYIEINERKNRFNRFEIRNIVKNDNYIIFSPTMVANFDRMLHYGIFDFYLPYEKGIENIVDIIKDWKHEYENRMPFDIAKLFNKYNPNLKQNNDIYINLDLYKHFKNELYDKDLGDYDVLVIDKENRIIWNIESKVIIKKGRIPDLKNENNSIKDYIVMFKRRIEFLKDNVGKILNSFEIKDENFSIKSYMVFNKVVSYENEDDSFKIICYGDIERIIGEEYNQK